MNILPYLEKLIDLLFASLPKPRPNAAHVANACIIAHRGAHDKKLKIVENTLDAFEQAIKLGCWGIEFDVRACGDGMLVVNHDSLLKRLWEQEIRINQLSFKELRALVPKVPSLTEVVEKYGKRVHLFIELKTPFVAIPRLAETLNTLTPGLDYHLLSLDETLLPKLSLFPKSCLLLVAMHNNVNKFCKLSLQNHYEGVLGHYFLLHDKQIKQLTAAKQITGVGQVNSKFSLYRELNRGIRFLFTNNAVTVCTDLQALRDSQK